MLTPYETRLPPSLARLKEEIEGYARGYGLDFFDTIFEVVDPDDLNEIAAFGGFPTRYPHWSFGMDYEELRKCHSFGLSRIYELVINNNPCYAYLMRSNSELDQKLVMAHVYGHCDFFKNNAYFAPTNRRMMDEMANHGDRVRRYSDRFGEGTVEDFLNRCLSLNDLIDPHSVAIQRLKEKSPTPGMEEENGLIEISPSRYPAKEYLESYINPPQLLKSEEERVKKEKEEVSRRFPEHPRQDILQFLLQHAPLKSWQHDILSMVREEAYYFSPQGQTKIMNEGWASYWHSTILTQKALKPSELIDFSDHHSSTTAVRPGSLNPYKLGLELFRDIEDRWNRGQFGPEYDGCDSLEAKRNWDRKLALGRKKIFEVRKVHNDITFLDTFLTPEFCARQKMFSYAWKDQGTGEWVIESRDFQALKNRLLFNLTNAGRPLIQIIDGNYQNRGELLLKHLHNGIDLDMRQGQDTLANIQFFWYRPVHLFTKVDEKQVLFTFDGKNQSHIEG